MTELDDFDYSWARPDPKAMAAAGITCVNRYLWSGGKGVTAAEIAALHTAGIGVILGYEADQGNHLKGAGQGAVDGAAARSFADALGVPASLPIYFACDQEVSDAQMPTVMAYLHAADSAAHPARPYSQKSVGDAFGKPFWQTLAWSNGRSNLAVIYQYAINQTFNGSAVDYNDILDESQLGAWWPDGHLPAGGGTAIRPTPPAGGTDMANVSTAEWAEVLTKVRALAANDGLTAGRKQNMYNRIVQTQVIMNSIRTQMASSSSAEASQLAKINSAVAKLGVAA